MTVALWIIGIIVYCGFVVAVGKFIKYGGIK